MRIGIDFDNTIVSYDSLFHKVARERGLVPSNLPPSKLGVRDYLRTIDREDAWTEMQGYVYGARMNEAAACPGVTEFLRWARKSGVAVSIVSHKTRHPFLGPKYDLHEAARGWVKSYLINGRKNLVEPQQVFFELTKEDKLKRIAFLGCDYFIDDLPEILLADDFPPNTKRILFDPDGHHTSDELIANMTGWGDILTHFKDICPPNR